MIDLTESPAAVPVSQADLTPQEQADNTLLLAFAMRGTEDPTRYINLVAPPPYPWSKSHCYWRDRVRQALIEAGFTICEGANAEGNYGCCVSEAHSIRMYQSTPGKDICRALVEAAAKAVRALQSRDGAIELHPTGERHSV